MAERVVKVRLSAMVQEYNASMLKAAQATKTVGTEAEKLAQRRQSFEQLGRAAMTAGGLMAAGVGLAVKKFADFDAAMSNVAATGQDARNSIDALRDAAIDAGARTVFSATESANAIEELAKAGISAADILSGGLNGALDLAAAGGLGVAQAAEIAATTMQQFQLSGSDASHVADLLAAGAGKAMGDVTDMGQALNQAGLVANQFGVSVEESVGVLSAFASAGMLGSDAGTSMRTMLLRLANPTKEVTGLMEQLGINAYDSQGQFIGLAGLAGELETSLGGMTDAQRDQTLAMIFGQDAIRGANILLREGADGIQEWTDKVNDQGYAAETARTKLDNLKGDVEALGGAFDSLLISMGSGANGPLRFLTQTLTSVVDEFNDLPDWAQQTALGLGAVTAAAGLAGGAFFLAVPKVAEFNAGLAKMGTGAQRAGRAMGPLARGLGAVTIAATSYALIAQGVEAANEALFNTSDKARNLVAQNRSLSSSFTELVESGAEWETVANDASGVLDRLGNLDNFFVYTASVDTLGRAAVGLAKTLQALSPELAAMPIAEGTAQFAAYADELGATDQQVLNMLENMPEFKSALLAAADAQGLAKDDASLLKLALGETPAVVQENSDALRELQGQAAETGDEVEDLADTIRAFGSAVLDTRAAKRDFEAAFDDLTESIKENGNSLDVTTEKGRANQAALDDLASSTYDYAAAVYEQTGSQEDANAVIAAGRARLVEMLGQFGITGARAEAYADKLGLIPDNISTAVEVQTGAAIARINQFVNSQTGRRITVRVDTVGGTTYQNRGSTIRYEADGGAIIGPGTGTSDSIPAMLSNGEHVLTAADVAAAGGQAAIYAWRRALHGGTGVAAFASGGAVTLDRARVNVERAEARLRAARTKDGREKARDALADAREELASARASFRDELRSFNQENRRGENRAAGMNGNGLSLVDRLIDVADNTGGAYGERLRKRALKQEQGYLKLEAAADAASDAVERSSGRLDELKSRVAQMASAVSGALRRTFDVSAWQAGSRQVASTRMVDGVAVTSVTNQNVPLTASGIAADAKAKASAIERFQKKLSRMRAMGYAPALVEEIAMLGTVAGEPVADAMLAGTKSEMQSINASYAKAGSYADLAGDQSAKAQIEDGKSMRELIAAADKQLKADERHAAQIDKRLQTLTDQVLRVLDTALRSGVKKAAGGPIIGPGTGTSDSIPAWLSNGENVWSAADVQRFGGQAAVERLKYMRPTAARYAYGGPVGADLAPVNLTVNNPVQRDSQKELNELTQIAARARRV